MTPLLISEPTNHTAPSAPSLLVKRMSYVVLIPLFIMQMGPLMLWDVIKFVTGFSPVASWPLKRVLFHRLLNLYITTFLGTQLPVPVSFEAEASVPKHNTKDVTVTTVIVQPVAPEDRIGFANHPAVDAETRPGFMLTPPGAMGSGLNGAKSGEKIIMYNVGGAYVIGHPLRSPFAKTTSLSTGLRLFAGNYRKALTPSSAFPAPLLDALAGYKYLVQTLEFEPENIIVMGDSAGGNLTLALVRYLSELGVAGKDYGLPNMLALNSPWVDMTSSLPSCRDNTSSDFVGGLGRLAVPSYTRHFPSLTRHPYFSPALADPADLSYLRGVHVYIQAGTKELLYDEAVALRDRLTEAGAICRLRDDVDGTHTNAVLGYPSALQAWLKDLKEMISSLQGTQ